MGVFLPNHSLTHSILNSDVMIAVCPSIGVNRVMAAKQNSMGESVERLEQKVDTLEAKPGRRWEGLVDKALFAAAGAILAWMAAGMPTG